MDEDDDRRKNELLFLVVVERGRRRGSGEGGSDSDSGDFDGREWLREDIMQGNGADSTGLPAVIQRAALQASHAILQ